MGKPYDPLSGDSQKRPLTETLNSGGKHKKIVFGEAVLTQMLTGAYSGPRKAQGDSCQEIRVEVSEFIRKGREEG